MRAWIAFACGMITFLTVSSMTQTYILHSECGSPKVLVERHTYDYVSIAPSSVHHLYTMVSATLVKRANGVNELQIDLNRTPTSSPERDPLSVLAGAAARDRYNQRKREERRARRERALGAPPDAPMVLLKGGSKRPSETSAEYLLRIRRTNTENSRRYKKRPEVRETRRKWQKGYDDEHRDAKRVRDQQRYQRHKESILAKAKTERQQKRLKDANATALEQAGGKPRSAASASAPTKLRKRSSEDAMDDQASRATGYDPLKTLAQAARQVQTADRKRRERHAREQRARLAPSDAPMVFIKGKKQTGVESAAEYLERVRASKRQSDIKWKSREGVHEMYKAHKREVWNARKDSINARRRALRAQNKEEFNRKRREQYKLKKGSQAKGQEAQGQDPPALVKRADRSSRRIDLNKSPSSTPSPPSATEKSELVSTEDHKLTVIEERRKRKNKQDRLSYAARMKRIKEANPRETVVLLHGSTNLANKEYIDRIRKLNRENQTRRLLDPKVRDKKRALDRARYQRRKETVRAYSRAYYAAHRDKYLGKVRERRKRQKMKAESEAAASRPSPSEQDKGESSNATPRPPPAGPVKRSLLVTYSLSPLLQDMLEHCITFLKRRGRMQRKWMASLDRTAFQKRSDDPPLPEAYTYHDPLLTLADAAREAEASTELDLRRAKDKARKAIKRQRPEVRELMRQRSKQYYDTHKQAVRAREKAYRTQNREKVNRLARERRQARARANKEQGPDPNDAAKAMRRRSAVYSVL